MKEEVQAYVTGVDMMVAFAGVSHVCSTAGFMSTTARQELLKYAA